MESVETSVWFAGEPVVGPVAVRPAAEEPGQLAVELGLVALVKLVAAEFVLKPVVEYADKLAAVELVPAVEESVVVEHAVVAAVAKLARVFAAERLVESAFEESVEELAAKSAVEELAAASAVEVTAAEESVEQPAEELV